MGHAGTLDPSAEGVLPIALEKTTKLISLSRYKEFSRYKTDLK